jgi:16S rRNA (adenine1518-N6/adenine1519-N6)-dimethyltransferase
MKIHKAKKSLGQNFLKSQLALSKIIEAGEIKSDLPAQAGDVILEIGPGKGALTRKLLEKSGTVIAVEKDRELFEFLKMKFEKEILDKKLILLNEDILEFDCGRFDLTQYKIIANIPYNITGAILKKFLTEKHQPSLMVLMVQHEVAKRITTPSPSSTRRGGKESLLSISVKAYGEPKMIMKVPARYFSPAPKVDSAVILIQNISRRNFIENDEEHFWEIVKAGFAHKRKKLSGNLKTLKFCQSLALAESGNKRAEDLTLEDWLLLAKQ